MRWFGRHRLPRKGAPDYNGIDYQPLISRPKREGDGIAELALSIFASHREDPRYTRIYKLAYDQVITWDEADEQIILLAMNDETKER